VQNCACTTLLVGFALVQQSKNTVDLTLAEDRSILMVYPRIYLLYIIKEANMVGIPKFSVNKRLLKSGHGLYVALPSEVIEQWNLDKGDEVSVSADGGAIKIMPRRPEKVENISEEMIETYSATMKGIQARVSLDSENQAIHIEFSGENKPVMNLFMQNLWQNLPVMLRLLGLGSVEEISGDESKKPEREEGQ